MLNRQLVFDTVASHLLIQGERSTLPDEIDTCAYRGEGGRKCALGCLIPDKKYNKNLETTGVYNERLLASIDECYGEIEDIADSGDRTDPIFLCDLQCIHDNSTPAAFRQAITIALADFAQHHKLDPFILVNCVRALAQGVAV